MMDRNGAIWGMLRAFSGFDSGFVYEWQPGGGLAGLCPGPRLPFPNGIELSEDGSETST